ncbi:GNAT family N-acetyltransferase [Vibrio maerlii]|uniref:GNAT family N-acetyltransferase n=1 Tax=Vibrio maerlii TaxID=2231648 RepID=UPI000E3BD10F|nr:GNAT family N-acetyltransferase [Vibrio maerlii]
MVTIRQFRESDAEALWHLFFNTIHQVNVRDYTQQQLDAWAPSTRDLDGWKLKMMQINPFVAEKDGNVLGYADLQPDGLIDHFFCHHEYQGKGVGRLLMEKIFQQAKHQGIGVLYSNVSITARPFFERFGFRVKAEQRVKRHGQILINYRMEKSLASHLWLSTISFL